MFSELNDMFSDNGLSPYQETAASQQATSRPVDAHFMSFISYRRTTCGRKTSTSIDSTSHKKVIELLNIVMIRCDLHSFRIERTIYKYIQEPKNFEKDIAGLNDSQRELVHAFITALEAENIDDKQCDALGEQIPDIAYSGRLAEWFEQARELSTLPPDRAPELWAERDLSKNENPAEFISSVYRFWLKQERMHQGALRSLDQSLYESYYSWKRSHEIPVDIETQLLTKKEYNTRQLSKKLPENRDKRLRLQRLKVGRKSQSIKP